MRQSSGQFEVCLESLPVAERGPEDVDASARAAAGMTSSIWLTEDAAGKIVVFGLE